MWPPWAKDFGVESHISQKHPLSGSYLFLCLNFKRQELNATEQFSMTSQICNNGKPSPKKDSLGGCVLVRGSTSKVPGAVVAHLRQPEHTVSSTKSPAQVLNEKWHPRFPERVFDKFNKRVCVCALHESAMSVCVYIYIQIQCYELFSIHTKGCGHVKSCYTCCTR